MTKKISASIDRIEGDYLICISDEASEEILLSKSNFPHFREKDIIEIVLENGLVISAEKNQVESERRLKNNSKRLRSLFDRNK